MDDPKTLVVDGAGEGAPNNDVDGAGAAVLPNPPPVVGAGAVVDPKSPPAVGAGAGVVDPKRPPDGAGADYNIVLTKELLKLATTSTIVRLSMSNVN